MILKVKNDLFDYPNRYIMQIKDGFKFSLASLLLAEFTKLRQSDKLILDMCTGNAPVPLVLSLKTDAKIIGFELQRAIAELAWESISINGLDKQIKVINDDVKNIGEFFKPNTFDVITCNPPYFKINDDKNKNKNDYLTLARHEIAIDLETIFKLVNRFLKDNGVFYMVHRAERLDEIIILANKYKLNVKEIQFISTKKNNNPSTILVKCVKNSKIGVKIKREICVDNLSTYQHLFEGSGK